MNLRIFASALAVVLAVFAATDVDAARMGGGRSLGSQRSVVPQRVAPPTAAPVQPAPPATAAAPTRAAPVPPAAAPARSPSRWLGPLAGLAAGIGLGALLSHFGMGADFGGFLLLLLAIGIGVFLIRRFFFARRPDAPQPLQYAGASGPGSARSEPVFNGARTGFNGGALNGGAANGAQGGVFARDDGLASAAAPASSPPGSSPIVMPPGFDSERFLRQARENFNRLQAAYDNNDRDTLADVMTPEMYGEIARDLDKRGIHTPTEVVRLDADMIDLATEGDRHWASVRFKGLIREDASGLPHEFEEVWNLTKPVDDSHGWLLAGVQQVR